MLGINLRAHFLDSQYHLALIGHVIANLELLMSSSKSKIYENFLPDWKSLLIKRNMEKNISLKLSLPAKGYLQVVK